MTVVCFGKLTLSYVSLINYCLPLHLKYITYNEIHELTSLKDSKDGFPVLPGNFGGFTVFLPPDKSPPYCG